MHTSAEFLCENSHVYQTEYLKKMLVQSEYLATYLNNESLSFITCKFTSKITGNISKE